MFNKEQISLIELIQKTSLSLGMQVYLVGGIVRDLLLKLSPDDRDLDFIIEGDSAKFCEKLSQELSADFKIFSNFLTAKLFTGKKFKTFDEVDFATARVETYAKPGSLPIVKAASLKDDLQRRDFSINAMAFSVDEILILVESDNFEDSDSKLKDIIIDPLSGLKDLAARKIRILHANSFVDDPTRLYRACRYCSRVSGTIEEETLKNFNSALNKNVLESVSKYRLFNEVKKFFQDSATSNILKLSRDLGLQSIYPGIESKAFEKIISAFDSIESENLCLNPKEKFNFGLMLMAYHVPSTAKQFFKDGQISKLEKIQIENELIDFQKIDLSKASKLQKLLVFSLNNSPEMLSGLK